MVRTLRAHGIEVTAIHSHTLTDQPRRFYLHFWTHDEDAVNLAQGLRAALDLTNSRKEGSGTRAAAAGAGVFNAGAS